MKVVFVIKDVAYLDVMDFLRGGKDQMLILMRLPIFQT